MNCFHATHTVVHVDRIKEIEAKELWEHDDDGYPNLVLKDVTFIWYRPIVVCDNCGKVLQFDGWGLCEPFQVSDAAKRKIKNYKMGL